MIPPEKIQEVRRLLDEGQLSHRDVAARTGVGRTTIGKIAEGSWFAPDRESLGQGYSLQPPSPPQRCPTCGGLVYMPCRVCKLRSTEKGQGGANTSARWPVERRRH